MQLRPTHAVIDLAALKHNYHEAQKRLPKNCGILTMVKADAYGHGAVPVAQVFEKEGCAALGVATVEEGIELREGGLKSQILVVGGLLGKGKEGAEAILKYHLTPVVHSAGVIDLLEEVVTRYQVPGTRYSVHLKVDSGMTRLGVTPKALPQLLERLKAASHLKLEGVMTHLAFRQNAEYTKEQLRVFKTEGEKIVQELGEIPVWHIANSAAVMDGPFDRLRVSGALDERGSSLCSERQKYWARPGIMLYGIPPYPEYSKKADLKSVLSLISKIVLIKRVPRGTKVSYNCTYTTTRESRIGVVPIGYADGYPWSLSGKAHVLVGGKKIPVLGRVTMDMIMVDVTDLSEAEVGSEVVLLGNQKKESISADQLAAWAGTIGYEIVCGVSKRIPRIYKQ
ncbi:MAG: alanine racemase [Deltaproteobacteria bacterium]|nr:alanine racemase [Deltaproteobacteria bacterium]